MKRIALVLSLLSISAVAQTNNNQQPKREHPPISAEMKSAFEECKTNGKPGEPAFDSCMESKGFKKPEHMHHGKLMGSMPEQNK